MQLQYSTLKTRIYYSIEEQNMQAWQANILGNIFAMYFNL